MNVTMNKMPAMRARFLAWAWAGRLSAADADPFREDFDRPAIASVVSIYSTPSFDPETYGVSLWVSEVYTYRVSLSNAPERDLPLRRAEELSCQRRRRPGSPEDRERSPESACCEPPSP